MWLLTSLKSFLNFLEVLLWKLLYLSKHLFNYFLLALEQRTKYITHFTSQSICSADTGTGQMRDEAVLLSPGNDKPLLHFSQ